MEKAGRVILFGDPDGLRQLMACGGEAMREQTVALAGAGIRKGQHEELADIADAGNLPLLIQPPRTSRDYPRFVGAVRSLTPDLIVINSYSMILGPELLQIPAKGAVNVHGAPLPECRGANAVEWSLIEERWLAGVTVHEVDPGIDTGPILAKRLVPVSFTDTWRDVRARVTSATGELLTDMLPDILSGRTNATPQDETLATHYKRRGPGDGRFEWDWPVRKIYNFIRALVAPHPGAFADCKDGTRTFDRFLPIGDVAGLKYSAGCGGRSFESDGLVLESIAPLDPPSDPGHEAGSSIGIAFKDPADPGSHIGINIHPIDWRTGSARCHVKGTSAHAPNLRSALSRFSARELGLTQLVYEDVAG